LIKGGGGLEHFLYMRQKIDDLPNLFSSHEICLNRQKPKALKNGIFLGFFPYIQNWLFWGGLGDKKLF